MIAFFEFEDVLVRSDGTPITLGVALLRLIRQGYRIALSTTADNLMRVQHWLLENGFPPDTVAYHHPRTAIEAELDDDELFLSHLDAVLFHAPVELVITASPHRAAMCLEQRSITALLFCSPATARPENRPGLRSWDEIEEQVSRRRILRTKATVGEDE